MSDEWVQRDEVAALGLDGSPESLMETIRRSLANEAGIEPARLNLAVSLVMRDLRAALAAVTERRT